MIERDRPAELRAGAWVFLILALLTAYATWSSVQSVTVSEPLENTARIHPLVMGVESLAGTTGLWVCGGSFVLLFVALAFAGVWGARRVSEDGG